MTTILKCSVLAFLTLTLMSREKPLDRFTIPTRVMLRRTATCLNVLPAFSPRLTCDSSLSSAVAIKTSADVAAIEEGNSPASTRIATASPAPVRIDEMRTGFFSAFVAFSIATIACFLSLPTSSKRPRPSVACRRYLEPDGLRKHFAARCRHERNKGLSIRRRPSNRRVH